MNKQATNLSENITSELTQTPSIKPERLTCPYCLKAMELTWKKYIFEPSNKKVCDSCGKSSIIFTSEIYTVGPQLCLVLFCSYFIFINLSMQAVDGFLYLLAIIIPLEILIDKLTSQYFGLLKKV